MATEPGRSQQTLNRLLGRLAEHHGLRAGVHPGYARMGRAEEADQAHPDAG